MAVEYLKINSDEELGQAKMSLDSFKDIATASVIKIKGVVVPKKASDIVDVKIKDDEVVLSLSLKLMQGIDIAKTCSDIQNSIFTAILEMTNVKCKAINIDITGFVLEKETI